MAGNLPIPSEGTDGRLLLGGIAGVCLSLSKWRLLTPQKVKDMGNYCVAPYPVLGVPEVYVQVSGMWDTANPPHKDGLVYGATLTLWLGVKETNYGYLGSFKYSSEEAGHAVADGADFQFTAHLIGTLIRLPL